MPPPSDGLGEPKKLMWVRFYVCALVPTELAAPAVDWLWERHQPSAGSRMVVKGVDLNETDVDCLTEMELGMEYVARGANTHDVRKKVWEALTVVGGTMQVQARVEAKVLASVWIDFRDYKHKDPVWLADKAFAAAALADEIAGRTDWPDDDQDPDGEPSDDDLSGLED